ncbi:MAG: helix-turn-helix domain-containing protein [Puniceicoccales bacterium]
MTMPTRPPVKSVISKHIKNPDEQNDFICGYRYCHAETVSWQQRITDRYGLMLCVRGTGEISHDSQCLKVKSRDLILLKPNYDHAFHACGDWDFLWFHFHTRPHVTSAMDWPEAIPGVGRTHLAKAEYEASLAAMTEAHQLDLKRSSNWRELSMLLLECTMIRGYNSHASESAGINSQMQMAQQLLIDSDDSIDQIAQRCGLSRAGLFAKFKKAVGVSPGQYREEARLRRAAQLLDMPGFTVSEIADQVGMPDPFYFSTRFRKVYKVSPSQYRKQLLKDSHPD